MNNELWIGVTINSGDREFEVPRSYTTVSPSLRLDEQGRKFLKVDGVRWFTTLDHGRRHEPIPLMTEEANYRFSKHKEIKNIGYQRYDNYNAIEVPYTDAIPADYKGIMGVPISFFNRYSPEQFELVGMSYNGLVPEELLIPGCAKYDRPYLNGKRMYTRLLIKHKGAIIEN